MSEPADFVARLRAERQDLGRKEALRRDREHRRRKVVLMSGAAALVLGGFGAWLAGATAGERPESEPYVPLMLDEAMWPDKWPATVRMPFRGSPAATWSEGADGIVLPEANAVGGLTPSQVGDALRNAKELLVEANLTAGTLQGLSPTRALNLLDPHDHNKSELEDTFQHPRDGHSPLQMFTRFDPQEVRVHGDVIKTRGTMTYEVSASGELLVHADYTFVYPVVKTKGGLEVVPGAEEVARVIVRRQLTLASSDGKLNPREYVRQIGNDDCREPKDGFIHPLFSQEAAKAPKWAPVDPYDTSKDIQANSSNCSIPTQT